MHWTLRPVLSTATVVTVFAVPAPTPAQEVAPILLKDVQVTLDTDGTDGYAITGLLANTSQQALPIYAISYEVYGGDRLLDADTFKLAVGRDSLVLQPGQQESFVQDVAPAPRVHSASPEKLRVKISHIWSDWTFEKHLRWQVVESGSSPMDLTGESP